MLSPLVLFLVIIVTLGMREVSTALSNPFGEDEVDLGLGLGLGLGFGLVSVRVRARVNPNPSPEQVDFPKP